MSTSTAADDKLVTSMKRLQEDIVALRDELHCLREEMGCRRQIAIDYAEQNMQRRHLLDAGRRLTNTIEFLEGILAEAPNQCVLLAQGVNRHFREVIKTSVKLQHKLFFIPSEDLASSGLQINPLISMPYVLAHLPFWLDEQKNKLAYCDRKDRRRVYATSLEVMKDAITGEAHIMLSINGMPPSGLKEDLFWGDSWQHLGPGSWRSMAICQPPCPIKIQVIIATGRRLLNKYDGIASASQTMDGLLDEIAATALQHSRQQS